MQRRFRQHQRRRVQHLEGIWDFQFLGDADPATARPPASYDDRMAVPGCFDATPRYAGKRGLAAYRTTVRFEDDTPYRLILDGVHHWCRVYLAGKPVGEHGHGFTRFAIDLMQHPVGDAELVVLVDNRFDDQRSPLHCEFYDWYHYGGIARGAELHRLGHHWIEGLTVRTQSINPPQLEIKYRVRRAGGPDDAEQAIEIDDVRMDVVQFKSCDTEVTHNITLRDAGLWSPANPNLHTVRITLGEDDYCERFGIRTVRVEGEKILLNDQPLRLLGVNRHDAHPQFGHAVPEALMVADVQQIKDLGCNFVRGAHYPQDLRFLDLCDEAGLLVWSEATGWGQKVEQLTNREFVDAMLLNVDEMVAAAINHPSVILWGVLNEGPSNSLAARPAYENLFARLRQLDPTRPVSFASNHIPDDVCFDLVDVASFNPYPGWYDGTIAQIPEQMDKYIAGIDGGGSGGGKGKPIIVSEMGAEALYGWRDWNEEPWSEQYQAKVLEATIEYLFRQRSRVCGLSIWQFCDMRTAVFTANVQRKARGFNNKGIVDEYRRPKQAYEVVGRLFRELQANE